MSPANPWTPTARSTSPSRPSSPGVPPPAPWTPTARSSCPWRSTRKAAPAEEAVIHARGETRSAPNQSRSMRQPSSSIVFHPGMRTRAPSYAAPGPMSTQLVRSESRIEVKERTEKVSITRVAQVRPVRHGRRRICARPTATEARTAPERCTPARARRPPANSRSSRFRRPTPRAATRIPRERVTKPRRMITGEIDSSKAGCR